MIKGSNRSLIFLKIHNDRLKLRDEDSDDSDMSEETQAVNDSLDNFHELSNKEKTYERPSLECIDEIQCDLLEDERSYKPKCRRCLK
jgi:hypothetical protein